MSNRLSQSVRTSNPYHLSVRINKSVMKDSAVKYRNVGPQSMRYHTDLCVQSSRTHERHEIIDLGPAPLSLYRLADCRVPASVRPVAGSAVRPALTHLPASVSDPSASIPTRHGRHPSACQSVNLSACQAAPVGPSSAFLAGLPSVSRDASRGVLHCRPSTG